MIEVDDPDGATIEEAEMGGEQKKQAPVRGTAAKTEWVIRNAVTQEGLFTVRADRDGEFEAVRRLTEAPCFVQAGVDGVLGPAFEVEEAAESVWALMSAVKP